MLVRVIRERTWVDQQLVSAGAERERQRVGMTVRSDGKVTQRSRVGDDTNFTRTVEVIAENVVAAVPETALDRCVRHTARAARVAAFGSIAEQPAALVVEATGLELELGAAEQHGAACQQRTVDVRLMRI